MTYNKEELKKMLSDTIKEYADRFVYADTDAIFVRNEMIISIYDCWYCYNVLLNGEEPPNRRDIVSDFDDKSTDAITKFMEKYNVHRLIVCEDGGIKIYTR